MLRPPTWSDFERVDQAAWSAQETRDSAFAPCALAGFGSGRHFPTVTSAAWPMALLLALEGPEISTEPVEPLIYNGEDVESCGWPSVVSLNGCTGTLIHPLIVLTAAHCVSQDQPIPVRFGEVASTGARLADAEYCRQGPGWTGQTAVGEDYAYCKLASPITSIPIIPVAGGCEQSAIQPGARIIHVGFGVTENGGPGGIKKMLDIPISNITSSGEIISGQNDRIICNGDSGGPAFVYLDPALGGDGTWRVAGIHSWASGASPTSPNCFGSAGSIAVWKAIDWIESDSGIDITPCTDGSVWSPTYDCGRQPTQPWVAQGAYTNTTGCHHESIVDFAAICGAPLGPDTTPPFVQFLQPEPEATFDDGSATVIVELDATDEGWGIDTVELTVRAVGSEDEQVDVRDIWTPWTWNLTLPRGAFELEAASTDLAGNVSERAQVCVSVGGVACPGDDPISDDTDSDSDSDSDSDASPINDPVSPDRDDTPETDTNDGLNAEGSEGCSCRATHTRSTPWFFACALVALRRRRFRDASRL